MSTETEWFGEPRRDPVVILDYDPSWPVIFGRFERQLREALGAVALRIDHVGSTAVPGLPAKPVIDIQVSVADVAAEDAYRTQIEALGYPLRAREPDHRFFRPPAGATRSVHIHVCSAGGEWERRHLLFVAYLTTHPERANEYGRLKKELAGRFGRDRDSYTNAKNDFIEETLRLAGRWAEPRGWMP